MAKIKDMVGRSLAESDGTTFTVASVIVALYMGVQMLSS